MVFSKHILSAFAGATAAYAASCGSTSSDTPQTVNNQGDASAVGTCTTFTGDIHISANAGPTLDFGKIQKITGQLSMDTDKQLTSLTLGSLTSLGSLSLTNLDKLATLTMPSLNTIGGNMTLENLPVLSGWDFGTNLQSAGDISVQNVQINSLGALSTVKKINSITISNCQFLQNLAFAVNEIDFVDIGPNNVQQGQNVSFPQLETATILTVRNSTTVSTPVLRNVSDTLSLIGNTFQSYGAQNLSWVGALVLVDNPQVTNLSFPSLQHINGSESTLNIQNNTQLAVIDGFPQLADVSGGDAIFAGNIKNLSLPTLSNVAGALVIETTESTFDCGPFQHLADNQTVRGQFTCNIGDPNASGSDNASSTDTGSGSSSSSKSAAHTELPPFLTTGIFAALLAFLV